MVDCVRYISGISGSRYRKEVHYLSFFFRWIRIIWTFFSEWLPFFKTRLWPRWHRNSQSLNDMDSNDTKDVEKWGRFDSISLELCKFCLRWSIWWDYSFWGQLCDLATPKSYYRHNLASIHATLDRNSILLKYRFFEYISPIVGIDELESGQAKFDGHETSFGKRNIFWIFRVGSKNQFNIIHVTSLKGQSVDRCLEQLKQGADPSLLFYWLFPNGNFWKK